MASIFESKGWIVSEVDCWLVVWRDAELMDSITELNLDSSFVV